MKILSLSRTFFRLAAAFALLAAVQGCIVSGKPSAGRSAFTASINNGQDRLGDSLPLPDQQTIRDRVVKAGKQNLGGNALNWSNEETGNRGIISALAEVQDGGRLCRTFQTTRESYDGVLLFAGKACKVTGDIWTIVDLKAL